MKLTRIEALPSHYFSEEAASRGRSEGLHLSDILEDIQQTLEPRDYDSEGRDWDPYRKLGFIRERALKLGALKAAYECGDLIDPGEIKVDEPNIAEIYVLDDRVRVKLEVYVGNLDAFADLVPDDWLRDASGRPGLTRA